MSQTIPQPQSVFEPRLLDRAVEAIRLKLLDLGWLEKSMGRARSGKKIVNGTKITYPECYESRTGDRYVLTPNDNLASQSFIIVGQQTIESHFENNFDYKFSAPCSLVFFVDKMTIDPNYNHDSEERIKWSILKLINNLKYFELLPGSTIQDEIEDVYREYSIDNMPDNLHDHIRYSHLRFNGTLRYSSNCSLSDPIDAIKFNPAKNYAIINDNF